MAGSGLWKLRSQGTGLLCCLWSSVLFLRSAARPAAPLWGPGRGGRARWGVGWGPKKFWGERHWWVCEHVILPRADKEVNTERLSDRAQVVRQVRGQSGPTQVPDAQLHGKPLARASERLSFAPDGGWRPREGNKLTNRVCKSRPSEGGLRLRRLSAPRDQLLPAIPGDPSEGLSGERGAHKEGGCWCLAAPPTVWPQAGLCPLWTFAGGAWNAEGDEAAGGGGLFLFLASSGWLGWKQSHDPSSFLTI